MRTTTKAKFFATLILTLVAGAASAAPFLRYAPTRAAPSQPSLYDKGLEALNNKDLAGANALFQQAAKAEPASALPLLGLAELARINNKPADIEQWINQAEKVAPNDPDARLASARLQFANGKYDLAARKLNAIVAADPKSLSALLDLGELYSTATPQPDKAAQAFGQAVAVNPEHAGAHFGLGNALMQKQQYDKAQAEFETVARLAPDNVLAQIGISQAQSSGGHYKEAIATLLRAQEKAPKQYPLALNLGTLYQHTGQVAAAYKAYEQAIQLAPDQPLAYNNLAWMAAERKERLDEALRWATKATTLAPNTLQFRDTLAWVKRAQGKPDEAATILEALVRQKGGGTPDHYYHLALIRAENGNKTAAIEALKQTLKVMPQHKEAAAKLKQLQKG
jgi:tetratricopeptide (TPR) repeat protein